MKNKFWMVLYLRSDDLFIGLQRRDSRGGGRERQPFLASQVKTLKDSGLNKLFQAQLIAQN